MPKTTTYRQIAEDLYGPEPIAEAIKALNESLKREASDGRIRLGNPNTAKMVVDVLDAAVPLIRAASVR
jgi:hypothetical protein